VKGGNEMDRATKLARIEAIRAGASEAPNTPPAESNKIPDEWYENDMAPSDELDKKEPDGFTDRLVEKYRKASKASDRAPPRRP
jgi:hypothetical protein